MDHRIWSMAQQNTRTSSRKEEVEQEILSCLKENPLCILPAIESYLVKQRGLTKPEFWRGFKDLLSRDEVHQPRAGCVARYVNGQYAFEFLEYIKEFGYRPINRIEGPVPGLPSLECTHNWKLLRRDGRFVQICSKCAAIIHVRKCIPTNLSRVLDVAIRLRTGEVLEDDVRAAVDGLNLGSGRRDRRKSCDLYACLNSILRLKIGLTTEDLHIYSKVLRRLLEVYKDPSQLKKMSRASRRRYSFVVSTLKRLPVRLRES